MFAGTIPILYLLLLLYGRLYLELPHQQQYRHLRCVGIQPTLIGWG